MTTRKALTALFALSLLLGLAPILSMLTATLIADTAGCMLNEGGSYPCTLLGTDMGDTLNVMFVAAWFFFLTWPFALIGILGLAAMGILRLIRAART